MGRSFPFFEDFLSYIYGKGVLLNTQYTLVQCIEQACALCQTPRQASIKDTALGEAETGVALSLVGTLTATA